MSLSLDAADVRLGRSVSIDQAAELLDVSRRTIYYRISQGRLETIRTRGGSQRVLVASLLREVRPQPIALHPSFRQTLGHSASRNPLRTL